MNIKQLRINKGMTQTELAAAAGISTYMVTAIERGVRQPSVKTAKRLAKILGCYWAEFFEK